MLFKNIFAYAINPAAVAPLREVLNDRATLEKHALNPRHKTQAATMGFVPALPPEHQETPENPVFIHEIDGFSIIKIGIIKALTSSSAIGRELHEKAAEFEKAEGYWPGRKIIAQMKDDITAAHISTAKDVYSFFYMAIDWGRGRLIVGVTGETGADNLTAKLREALGGLPIALLTVKNSVSHSLTSLSHGVWAEEDAPPFSIGDTLNFETLDKPADKQSLRLKGEFDPDFCGYLADRGFVLQAASLHISERVNFTITDRLQIKNIKLLFESDCQIDPVEDPSAKFTSDCYLELMEIRNLLHTLLGFFGGMSNEFAALEGAYEFNPKPPANEHEEGADHLQGEAEAFVQAEKQCSISSIQRKLRIGYNRAARIVESMEGRGVVNHDGQGRYSVS